MIIAYLKEICNIVMKPKDIFKMEATVKIIKLCSVNNDIRETC